MANHPNRSKQKPSKSRNPTPEEISGARESSGLTQEAAATLVHSKLRSWQQWEAGDRRMHPAFFELFNMKRVMTQPASAEPRRRQRQSATA